MGRYHENSSTCGILEAAAKLLEYPKLYRAGRVPVTREMVGQIRGGLCQNARTVTILNGMQQWPPLQE
ncbi:hypothetical protein [Mesorhizobium sp. RMAD-H1]|uniref:hypothetical protein n=1 Tax=Mesorhizobium sp. RMAD-H1 TaxID=2587065 RepID=UPI0016083E61|nr:hypothetical protein [Mesorhizobium sp. RMAD-H1]MBB2973706.1 hypothetical protein [Mesorhizobium sp. RMAD-H1]